MKRRSDTSHRDFEDKLLVVAAELGVPLTTFRIRNGDACYVLGSYDATALRRTFKDSGVVVVSAILTRPPRTPFSYSERGGVCDVVARTMTVSKPDGPAEQDSRGEIEYQI